MTHEEAPPILWYMSVARREEGVGGVWYLSLLSAQLGARGIVEIILIYLHISHTYIDLQKWHPIHYINIEMKKGSTNNETFNR